MKDGEMVIYQLQQLVEFKIQNYNFFSFFMNNNNFIEKRQSPYTQSIQDAQSATTIYKTNQIYQILWGKVRNIYNSQIQKISHKGWFKEKQIGLAILKEPSISLSKRSTLRERE